MSEDIQGDDAHRDPTALRAELLDLLAGFMRTQALATFAKLGVADVLSPAPRRIEALAADVGADGAALYRLLRYLATIGVAEEVAPREFASTPYSDGFRRDAPLSVRWIAIAFGAEHYRA